MDATDNEARSDATPRVSNVQPGSVTEGPASAGGTVTDPGMASLLTGHAQISGPDKWEVMAAGIDTLDFGVDVRWGALWEHQKRDFDYLKQAAANTEGIPSHDNRYLVRPKGATRYRWHLEWPDFHMFLSPPPEPNGHHSNARVSLSARVIWLNGAGTAVGSALAAIESLGGSVLGIKLQRCDLAVDFRIPGGLSLDFLRHHRVPIDLMVHNYEKGDDLQTFYAGVEGGPTQLRIYDKGLEMSKRPGKEWFLDIWQTESPEDIWRVEFELRRERLREWGVNTLAELKNVAGAGWGYLTQQWFSLRLHDNANTTRRTVHPWWDAVNRCSARFGSSGSLPKIAKRRSVDTSNLVSRCASALASFAVRERIPSIDDAIEELNARMREYWSLKDFDHEYVVRSVKEGFEADDRQRTAA